MARKSQHVSISALVEFMLAVCVLLHSAIAQSSPAQQVQSSIKTAQQQPSALSLPQLYRHFLVYQNHLDTKAAELTAQGKDGSALHDALQKKSGLSDADYALVRTSSTRLATKLKDLDTQAATIRSSGSPLSSEQLEQLRVLMDHRATAINFEVDYLKQNLSPDKVKAFEAFLIKLYSHANVSATPPFASSNSASSAVQK